jgi:uncharacterized protein (DUF1330 family)
MAKAYWIARIDVSDSEAYKNYALANQAAFKKYGATYLVRGGEVTCVEGASRARNVVIEFPSLQAAKDCYASKEYAVAKAMRDGASVGDLIIIEGYTGAQP